MDRSSFTWSFGWRFQQPWEPDSFTKLNAVLFSMSVLSSEVLAALFSFSFASAHYLFYGLSLLQDFTGWGCASLCRLVFDVVLPGGRACVVFSLRVLLSCCFRSNLWFCVVSFRAVVFVQNAM